MTAREPRAGQPARGRPLPWTDDTIAANGQAVRENFAAWFGHSKVVDAAGNPAVVYHGTAADVAEFRASRGGEFGPAVYTTDSPREAAEYGDGQRERFGTNVMPVFVSIRHPYTDGVEPFWKDFGRDDGDAAAVARARAAGYDGVIATRLDRYYDNVAREFVDRGDVLTHFVAFDAGQVKSAIGNSGLYQQGTPLCDQVTEAPADEMAERPRMRS